MAARKKSDDDEFVEFVLDQLRRFGGVAAKRMFGGYGLYQYGVFFGIIAAGRFYLKTDDHNRAAYIEAGMKPFRAGGKKKITLKTYYEVPADVLEDASMLAKWAEQSVRCKLEDED